MKSIPIIYEDSDIIVVNKPAGLEVREVALALRSSRGEAGAQLELAHRLDRDTSGILLLAKHERAHEYLKQLFQERKIKKTYIALVEGLMKEKEGTIDLPIGRSPHHPSRRVAFKKIDGKKREAVTIWRVKKYFPQQPRLTRRDQYTLLEVMPQTGRTHQIRVHLKAIGHPVACDKLYFAKTCPDGLTRQFLHAYALEFILPPASPSLGGSGGTIRLEAELPRDLQNTLDALS
jgi:23S rRNA pseudouridine1911/1915/1917 synthase